MKTTKQVIEESGIDASLIRSVVRQIGDKDGFGCLKTTDKAEAVELADEIGRALYGKIGEKETQVANALAWFALEEVARAFCDE